MSSSQCRECKAQLSNGAKRCQKCGADQRNWFMRHKIISFLLGILLLVLIGGVIGGNDETRTTGGENSEDAAPEEIVDISAAALAQAYDTNEIAADRDYKNKLLRVTGIVQEISTVLGSSYVVLDGENLLIDIQCSLEKNEQERAAELLNGQEVTMVGRNQGQSLNVSLKNCVFE